MKHPRIVDDEDEEVTAVTHEINQLRGAREACEEAAEQAIRVSDSIVKSLTPTPPEPRPAEHVHRRDCWLVYTPCSDEQHGHDWTCGTGELSSRCPEIREELERLDRKKEEPTE